ncbi:hypothetical protein [Fibrella aestuarina]|uniref:hypothetical protein n=1 Tax=Fibrella aestuarina TaxID=651143 RepID=UPI00059D8940|nr:hypothetical protein [Fibrella aestuarina]
MTPTFDEFASFLRERLGVRKKQVITPKTLLEDELGVTGDDGIDLLEAVERQYAISLSPLHETFSMQPNELLFQEEGLGIHVGELSRVFKNLFRKIKEPGPVMRKFQVGELYEVVCRLKQQQAR